MSRQRKAKPGGLHEKLLRAEKAMARKPVGPAPEMTGSEPVSEPDDDSQVGDTFEADIPETHPSDATAAFAQSLQVLEMQDTDYDRLWDWIRADDDKGAKFLGVAPISHSHMRQQLSVFGDHLFALWDADEQGNPMPVGFFGLNPVTDVSAGLHLYVSPPARGQLGRLIPQLMTLIPQGYPGRTFALSTMDAGWARLLAPHGFTIGYLLMWAPPSELTGDEEPTAPVAVDEQQAEP